MEHETVLTRGDVLLRPLHYDDAEAMLGIVEEQSWQGMAVPVPRTVAEARQELARMIEPPTSQAFAVERDGRFVGRTGYYDLVPGLRTEVGNTYYADSVRGSDLNPTCKLLLLGHAFDALGLHRVALRCDHRNVRSHQAIARLGATFEGTLRGFRHGADGSIVDVDYFSVLAPEWPRVRDGLLARLGG